MKTDSYHYYFWPVSQIDLQRIIHYAWFPCGGLQISTHTHNIKPGVALSIMIQQGASPLYLACQEGHDDVVQLLLNGGARIDLPAKVL